MQTAAPALLKSLSDGYDRTAQRVWNLRNWQSIANSSPIGRMMVFVDGTNFLIGLDKQKLKVARFMTLFEKIAMSSRRLLVGAHIYTVQTQVDKAREVHGPECFEGCRLVLGDEINTPRGGTREKCVDELLVADMIYHAALKNCDYVLLVSHDTDFRYAIKRVQDFGCRTALCTVGADVNERLQTEVDDYISYDPSRLGGIVERCAGE